MDSFVWQALLSMALFSLSAMIYACCNHRSPTTGASTRGSCFLQLDETMMCTNLFLEEEPKPEIFKGKAEFSTEFSQRM